MELSTDTTRGGEKPMVPFVDTQCRFCGSDIVIYADPNDSKKRVGKRYKPKYHYDVCAECASKTHHSEQIRKFHAGVRG